MHGTRKTSADKHPASYFVERITKLWNQQVETILETGRLLREAKGELDSPGLPHGEFGVMVAKQLPFGARTAQMLMTIARHPILSNAKYVSHLPPCWGTLYDLASIPDCELIDLIETNQIHPGMERADVKKFHFARLNQVPRAIELLMDFMHRVPPEELAKDVLFNNWPHEMFATALRKLPSYIEELLEAALKFHNERSKAIDEYAAKLKSGEGPIF